MTSSNTRANQRERELFHKAYAGMEPSDATVERILDMTTRKPHRHTAARPSRRLTVRAAVVTAAATALLASGAYAAVSSGFFESAFGPKGQQDMAAGEVVLDEKVNPNTGETTVSYFPERTWANVDVELAKRLVGAYVEEVGKSAEMCGYALAVESCVVDENGLGVATAVISNPEGVQLWDSGAGIVFLDNAAPTTVEMGSTEARYSFRMVMDADASTDTEVRVAVYFGPFAGAIGEEGVTWYLPDKTARDEWELVRKAELDAGVPAEELTPYVEPVSSFAHKPVAAVPAAALTCEAGGSVEISPLGLMAYQPVSNDSHDPANADPTYVPANSLSASEVVVRYADGSEYVVSRSGTDAVNNVNTSFALSDGTGSGYLFNRLVDVDAVESVSVVWRGYLGGAEYEETATYAR